jgi:hypothetical protein
MSFGYDIGIISGMMQPIREKFHLTCSQEQVLVGCLIGGALIVSICGGKYSLRIGTLGCYNAGLKMFAH